MSYGKFTVNRIEGRCAILNDKYKTGVGNFGFSAGDVVEWWDYDGYCPSKIIVNGIQTWGSEDKVKWHKERDERYKVLLASIPLSKPKTVNGVDPTGTESQV